MQNNNGQQEQNKPGWELLKAAALRVLEVPKPLLVEMDEAALTERVTGLVVNCMARIGETIPEEHKEEVLNAVAGAYCHLGGKWDDATIDFFLSQEDGESLRKRLAAFDYDVLICPCGCGNLTIAPAEAISQLQKKLERGPLGFLMSLADIFGSPGNDKVTPEEAPEETLQETAEAEPEFAGAAR